MVHIQHYFFKKYYFILNNRKKNLFKIECLKNKKILGLSSFYSLIKNNQPSESTSFIYLEKKESKKSFIDLRKYKWNDKIFIYFFLKGKFDKFIAILLIFMLFPLFALISLGIKISSPGPIFYKQKRHGINGEHFNLWKFRSMYFQPGDDNFPSQAKRKDRRITPFGSFLRRTSLDELPQLLNVIQGHMSIVGPRPHAVQHNLYYSSFIRNYMKRHYVKPGITGLAQVNGLRGETSDLSKMEKRIQYDLIYIHHLSLYLDLKIIIKTLLHFFNQKNAY